LEGLSHQDTGSFFTYSIVVVDNDIDESARTVAFAFSAVSTIPLTYRVEPRQSIALARNAALASATGEFVAFIDDDEEPTRTWLLTLFMAIERYAVDGALGPVRPRFESPAPSWIVTGRFYERPTYQTGFLISWAHGRTNNTLFKKAVITGETMPFDRRYITGEDQDFFRRLIAKGHRFVWCNEALVYEVIPPARWKRSFLIRRALQRGQVSTASETFAMQDIIKSLLAVPLYLLALPVFFIIGHHWFMRYLVKLVEHLARLLAIIGLHVAEKTYVTE
jgi:cellulose synthase/poly-beta-1,6-N-acetylglucosamine synthase-like glycosyltransferase